MGVTFITGTVVRPFGGEVLDFLVDSGSQYTLLPETVWQKIGVVATRRQRFRLADGTLVEREIANCVIRLAQQGATPTPVVLGRENDVALLGALTLEELRLVLNPFSRTLQPVALLMV